MADYNIYIHSSGGGSVSKKTTPFANQDSESNELSPFTSVASSVQFTQNTISQGFTPYVNSGVSALKKVIPAVALVTIGAGVADKVITTATSYIETYTGYYEYNLAWNNFKTVVSNILNPFGAAKKIADRILEYNKQNTRIEQERTLVGESILTTYIKGV